MVGNIIKTTTAALQSIPGGEKVKVRRVSSQYHQVCNKIDVPAKAIILSGGFARNKYVRQEFNNLWERPPTTRVLSRGYQILSPNTTGALQRYDNPHIQALGHKFNLAVVRDEERDPEIHGDATLWLPPQGSGSDGKEKAYPKPGLTCKGVHDKSIIWARDRLQWIYKEGRVAMESWSLHQPTIGQVFVFRQRLIWSAESDGTDGEALWELDPREKDGKKMRPHLKWFLDVKKTIKNVDERNWAVVKHPDSEDTYEIAICTKPFVGDDDIRIGLKVADVGDVPEAEGQLISAPIVQAPEQF